MRLSPGKYRCGKHGLQHWLNGICEECYWALPRGWAVQLPNDPQYVTTAGQHKSADSQKKETP